jgi:8-oxo-dGTP diphosphatase
MALSEPEPVRAAGGIVRRRDPAGRWELLLVHRPRYADWTFPKGKADPGEPDEEAALREVAEETGLRCALGGDAGVTRYTDGRGRPKVVRYFLMEPTADDHEFVPNHEVDALCWTDPAGAGKLLTYAHDRELLCELPEEP